MSPNPLRLLLAGYALSAAAAAALLGAGGAVLAALLVFWIGGAVAVLGLAVLPGLSQPFRAPKEDVALEVELRRWEEDKAAEAAEAAEAKKGRAVG